MQQAGPRSEFRGPVRGEVWLAALSSNLTLYRSNLPRPQVARSKLSEQVGSESWSSPCWLLVTTIGAKKSAVGAAARPACGIHSVCRRAGEPTDQFDHG